jgi:tripartite-type tricarboxylate transporter receptor subunit TctC
MDTLRVLPLGLLVLACLWEPHPLAAQAPEPFPTRNVRLIVAFGAGGTSDVLARVLGQKLGERWSQTVVIENRAGAGGNLAAAAVAAAPADGTTLLLTTQSLAVNVTLQPSAQFDPVRDFDPIMVVATAPTVLLVSPASKLRNVADLIGHAKAHPDELTYGSAGNGTVGHLSMELIQRLAGIRLRHVPYNQQAMHAYVDLMQGRVDVMLPTIGGYVPQIQAGQYRALAVSGTRRQEALPDVPTLAEAGVAQFEPPAWYGLYAPKGTPAAVIAKINADARATIALAEVQTRFAELGFEPIASSPEELGAKLRSEIAKWTDILKDHPRAQR